MLNKTIRSALSLLLVFCLLFGMSGNAIALAVGNPADKALEKVDPMVYGKIDELNATIDALEEVIDELEFVTLPEASATLADAKQMLLDAEEELAKLTADIENGDLADGDVTTANKKLAEAQQKLADAKDMLEGEKLAELRQTAYDKAFEQFSQMVADAEADAWQQFEDAVGEEYKTQSTKLQNALKDAENELKQMIADKKAELNQTLADKKQEMENEIAAKQAELDAKLADAEAQLDAKLALAGANQAAIDAAHAEFEAEAAAAQAEFDAKAAEARAKFDEAKAEAEQKAAEAEAKAWEEYDAKCEEAWETFNEEASSAVAAEREKVQQKINEAKAEAKVEFENKFEEEFNKKLAEMQEQVDAAEDAMKKVEAYVAEVNDAVAYYQGVIDDAKQIMADAEKLIDDAHDTIDVARETIADARELVDTLEKSYNDLRAAVTAPQPSVSFIKETIAQVEANYNAAWDALLALDEDIDALIASYDELAKFEVGQIDVHRDPIIGFEVGPFEVKADTDGDGVEETYGMGKTELPTVDLSAYDVHFEGVTMPAKPEMLDTLDTTLDNIIAKGITLDTALRTYVAAAEKVVAKTLDVTEDAVKFVYNGLKNNLSRDMHIKAYNWLYNNPDKVCALVEEFGVFGLDMLVRFGPYALDLLNDQYDLAVLAMKLTLGGTYLTVTLGAKALGYLGDRFDFVDDYREYVAKAVAKLYAKYGDETKALAKVYIDYLELKDRYYNATHADYTIFDDSKLLVIGDRSAAAGYAELLAKMLYENENFNVQPFFNSTADMKTDWSNTTDNVIDMLDDWAGLVAGADLITVGFGNMTAVRDMIDGLLSEKFDKDWSKLVGDTAAELVQKTLNEIELEMKARGMSKSTIDTVMLAAQHYAYTYAQQLVNYPELINKLQAMNKDAQIVIVGAYNELNDVTVIVNGNEIAIAKYVQPLIDAMNMQSMVEGFFEENVIYVHAPEVKNDGGKMTFDLSNEDDLLAFALATEDDYLMMPDLASQEYVAKMIFEALNITDKRTVDEPVPPTTEPVPPTTEPVVPPTTEPVVPPTTEPVVPPTTEPVVPPEACPHLYKFIVHTEQYHWAENCQDYDLFWDRVVCYDCGAEWIEHYSRNAGPHIWGDPYIVSEPEGQNPGIMRVECTLCDEYYEYKYYDCYHYNTDWAYDYQPGANCQEMGYEHYKYYCLDCGEILDSGKWEIGLGNHVWGDPYVVREPEGWNPGTKRVECTVCDEYYEYEYYDCYHYNTDWAYDYQPGTNCQEMGYGHEKHYCLDCGEVLYSGKWEIGVGPHIAGEVEVVWENESSCWKEGQYLIHCQYCDETWHDWHYEEYHDYQYVDNTYDAYYCNQWAYREWGMYCAKCDCWSEYNCEQYGRGEHHNNWSDWWVWDNDEDYRICWDCWEYEWRTVECRHVYNCTLDYYEWHEAENCQDHYSDIWYYTCNDCGHEWTEKYEYGTGDHHENTYDVYWTHFEATYCYQVSYDEYDTWCADCGAYLGWWREYYENGSRHRWSGWISCSEHDNCNYRYCRYCGEVEHRTNQTCDHKNTAVWEYDYKGNCLNQSYYYWELYCEDCGVVLDWYEEFGEYGDHSWSRWYWCYEHENCRYRYCRYCGEEEHRTYESCDHKNTYEEMYHEYIAYYCWEYSISYWDVWCADCGMWIDWYYVIGETGSHHEMGDWYVSVEPTETTEGELRRECWYCDYHETKRLPATGVECDHSYITKIENVVAADCVNTGSYDKVIYCEFCGEEFNRETIITDALGHSFGDWKLHKLPTCTERGQLRRYCERCDCFESIELPALNEFDIDVPDYRDEIMDLLRKIYNFLGDEVFNLMSTSGNYNIGCESLYVAIGDSTALSGGYAEMLAEMLKVPNMENLSEYELTVNGAIDLVGQNAELISKADLITLGFSNLAASVDMLNALNGMYNADWSDAIGETAAKAIEKAMAELKQQLIQEGLDAKTVDMVLDAANTYAYTYASRALRYPDLVKAVREVNPNALIVIVGAYNDLENVIVDVNGHNVNIGKLAEYLIYAANFESMLMSKVAENVVYAHAPEVETVFETMDYENLNNLGYLMSILNDEMLPTDAGHAYIAEQIYKALNVSHAVHPDLIEVIENVIQPDCVNMGSYDEVIYCGVCGMELYRETVYVDALGHNFGCWQLHKVPTFHQEGELRRYCDRCGCYESLTLPKLWNPDFDFDFDYRDEFMDMLRKLYELLGDGLFEIPYDATHADYTIYHDSLYVAIGDSTALSDSYVDDLAELLEIPHMMQNLAQPGLTVSDAIDMVGANADLISKADLITLGFSNIDASVDMLNALNGMYTADWSDAVGETVAKTIDKALAELKDQLIQEGMDDETVTMVLDAANAYAYAYAARAMRYPALVEAVREVNPDALIVLVGAYNDLEGVVVDVNGRQVNVGKYAEYLIYAANLENLLQAIHGEDVIYVHAPEVETIFEENDYQNLNNLGYLMSILNDEMLPSEAGHQYIAQKIFEALEVKYQIWGDVNGDRRVDCRDARLILRYRAGLITEDELDLTWADVNGDGRIDARDARWILRVRADLEEHFPVCP